MPLDIAHEVTSLAGRFNRGQTATELALETLRTAILEGRIPSGYRMTENEVSQWLAMSRTPVREALTRIQAEGLLTQGFKGSLEVKRVTLPEYLETFAAREALEAKAAALASRRATLSDVARLTMLTDKMESSFNNQEWPAFSQANMLFHQALWSIAGNHLINRFLIELQTQALLFHRGRFAFPGREPRAIAEHREIIAAIEAQDPERAAHAAAAHVAHAREDLEHLAAQQSLLVGEE